MPAQPAATQAQVVSVAQQPNGTQNNTYQIPQQHWLKIAPMMQETSPPGTRGAFMLPYVLVRNHPETTGQWQVISTGITPSSASSAIRIPIEGPGQYRLYVKEPTLQFTTGDTFEIPMHSLANGQPSNSEVQPWYAVDAAEGTAAHTLTVSRALPNTLNRPAADYRPTGEPVTLTNQHLSQANALNLGEYVITHILWGDISQAYGANHPTIAASAHRAALEDIYGERLTAEGNARILNLPAVARQVYFDSMSTSGGSQNAKSFQNNFMMSRNECLRRTHPTVLEFLLETMQSLNLHYARVTGAWRPHTGSVRHRYASALDLTHMRTRVEGSNGQPIEVEYRFHRTDAPGPDSNPLGAGTSVTAQRRRAACMAFHHYIAQQRQGGTLGWLGGPWALTYANVGLAGSSLFIKTDAIHVHHVHLSVGVDQP